MPANTPVLLPGVRKHPTGPGYQVRIAPFPAKTFPDADAAHAYALELRALIREGVRVAPTDTAATLTRDVARDLLTRYQRVGGRNGRPYSPAGMKAARRDARPWTGEHVHDYPVPADARGRLFAETPIGSLDVGAVGVYLEERAAGSERGRAAVGEWQFLRSMLELAQRRGLTVDQRLFHVGVQRRKTSKRTPLTFAELDYLVRFAPEHIRRIFPIGQRLGGRIMELLQADESWLDLKARTFTIPAWARKNGTDGDLVLDLLREECDLFRQQLVARGGPSTLLFPRRHGTAWAHSHFYRQVVAKSRHRAARAWRAEHGLAVDADTPFEWAKVDEQNRPVVRDGAPVVAGIAPHDLRRGAATWLLEAGIPADLAAIRLGHKDAGQLLVTTYATARRERLRAELDRIDNAGGFAAVIGE